MGSLRTFHLAFVMIVFVLADMFGAWAVYDYSTTRSVPTLIMGVVSFIIGFALIVYLVWFLRKLDRARIE